VSDQTIIAWTDVPGHPGYRVSRDGVVESRWRRKSLGRYGTTAILGDNWHALKPGRATSGHLFLQLGRGQYKRVHRLVLEAFVGPCPEGAEACHFPDRDPGNCALANLRWGTSADNTEDQRRHGTLICGEQHGMATISESTVQTIRSLAGTMTHREIGERCGVSQGHVTDIINKRKRARRWTHHG